MTTPQLQRSRAMSWATSVSSSQDNETPIMVNGFNEETVKAVIEAAGSAGMHVIEESFGPENGVLKFRERKFRVHGPSNRENVLKYIMTEYPNLVVVDYTVSDAVNANAELYSKFKVPFVMRISGGNKDLLYSTVKESEVYAVISSEMVGEVLAFREALEYMANKFPRVLSGLSLKVVESQEATKVDVSETTKDVISILEKLGVHFNANKMHVVRDPTEQLERLRVPQKHLDCHAYHHCYLTAVDETVSLEFKLNVGGRSLDAHGAINAVIFLSDKVAKKAPKKIYNMIDVLEESYRP